MRERDNSSIIALNNRTILRTEKVRKKQTEILKIIPNAGDYNHEATTSSKIALVNGRT